MTMLDRMRRHRNWLKWSLGLVVLAFVIFYIPDFLRSPTSDLAAADTVAIVEGQEIRGDEFRRTYQNQLQAYRQAYGNNMSDRLLKQLGIDQQILQQMVDERAALAEAERLNVRVSDEEVRKAIMTIPALQENGVFIGEERYQQLLQMQNPPVQPAAFEENVRRSLTIQKLRAAVTDWLSVPDKELEAEYRRRNDKVKLAVVSFPADSFRSQVTVSDPDIATHFDGNKESFRVPEKRKIKYVLIDTESLRAKVTVPDADVQRAYNDRMDQFSTPEQIRASHILLRTEGKEEAAVRTAAEDLLKQARGDADFAELARKHSEDKGSAVNGGDLDYFGRGQMVPEFDAVAFALTPGQISELVKTQFGFHVIKVIDKKGGITKPIDEVRKQLADEIAAERAQTQASELAEAVGRQITKPEDIDTVAKARGLQVSETAFFSRTEPILGLGAAPEIAARAFDLKPGEVSGSVPTGRGFVIASLVEKRDPYIPQLDEVKEAVRDQVIQKRALDLSRQKAADLAAKLKTAADFSQAAKTAGATVDTTELLTRDSPLPVLGNVPDVMEAAFTLAPGAVSDALPTEQGTAIIKVLEKQEVTASELTSNKDRFREELLADRRNRFFSAYMVKAKEKMKIEVNREAVQRLIG